jgi:hypothetical protein
METSLAHLITIRIGRGEDGNFVAKSDDLPGFLLVYPEHGQIVADIPETVKMLYKAQYGEDVEVALLDARTDPPELKEERIPVAAIPTHLLREWNRKAESRR